MLSNGIYEQIINNLIKKEINSQAYYIEKEMIDIEEAPKVLAKYVSSILEKGLMQIKDKGGDIYSQVELCNHIIDTLINKTGEDSYIESSVDKQAELLLAIASKGCSLLPVMRNNRLNRPATSIAQSSLFTGAIHEPSMFSELKKEILSSDRIDMLVSFIKWSGVRLIIDELIEFTKTGSLRIITTSYMGATDLKAVKELSILPNTEIKISYDTKRTRLHAKAYVFYRKTGFTTAYVGSSNLSNAAISSGLEWNVKVTTSDLPDAMQKINATFESYWNDKDFETYTSDKLNTLEKALQSESMLPIELNKFIFDISPYPYQEEILEKLKAEREVHDQWRNLVVAATGTGKTVISAFDYKSFIAHRKQLMVRPSRFLFVAHREEILTQSLSCFRTVLKDPNFGELLVGSFRPSSFEQLFISIQSFNSTNLAERTSSDYYDYIVVDEFHHSAAPSYQKLLTYYNPKVLLGLTATPERMDGKNILEYFGDRIAAEIRLPEAIDRKLLCPFQYFGVSDSVHLDALQWTRGGYDVSELNNVYTMSGAVAKQRAQLIIDSINKYVTNLGEVKGLGFCVSVKHAEFMADSFNSSGIPSTHLVSTTSDNDRNSAKKLIVSGKIKFIFVVDLYNEGIDIPEINTILFLRPTESLTVFLQQLGRGLRLFDDKECLTVLDFIGQAHKKYSFEEKFTALLSNTRKSVQREIKEGFVSLPKGCYIQLEKMAKNYILSNISEAIGLRSGLVTKIKSFDEETGKTLSLKSFLDHYHLVERSMYHRDTFSRLCVSAGINNDFKGEEEEFLRKALLRLSSIDSRKWIKFLLKLLKSKNKINEENLSIDEQKLLNMFYYTVWQKPLTDYGLDSIADSLLSLQKNVVLYKELLDLLEYRYEKIDFIDEPVILGSNNVLDLHCTYSRDQILAGLNYYTYSLMPSMREGVLYLQDQKIDVFLITLNKAEKDYSPSTMYKDYSINEYLFHMQSQSTTSSSSPTGQRYINHKKTDNLIAIFIREFKKDYAGATPYVFLGLADYVGHEGSKPMNIIWRLKKPIPPKFLKQTKKLIAG